MKFNFLVVCLATIALSACSKDDNANNSTPDNVDSKRGLLMSYGTFTPLKQTQDLEALNSTEFEKVMQCEKPSTETRLDKENFSMGWQITNRFQSMMDAPVKVLDAIKGYSTENDGNTYTSSLTINKFTIDETNFMETTKISYNDVCSRSEGCDRKRRSYISGSPMQWVKISNRYDVQHKESLKVATQCNFRKKASEKVTREITEGTITLGSAIHSAVSIKTTTQGEVTCYEKSMNKNVYVGDGTKVTRTIVLTDQLPNEHETSNRGKGELVNLSYPYNNSGSTLPCSRTIVYSAEEIKSEGTRIKGHSYEVSSYTLNGKVQTLEEWDKAREIEKETLRRLKEAVNRAEVDLREAKTAHERAKTNSNSLQSQFNSLDLNARQKENNLKEIEADPNSTEEEIERAKNEATEARKLAAEAKARYEISLEQVEAAKEAKQHADEALSDAEEALRKFKEKMQK